MTRTVGLAAHSADAPLSAWEFERRDLRPDDIAVAVDYCGVCHSDLHAWHGETTYGNRFPLVPGHEFVGRVAATGEEVTDFDVDDAVAVGNIVDSCARCEMCTRGHEQACLDGGPTQTYGGTDRHDGTPTYGAYSALYVVKSRFAYHLPATLDAAAAAPLMCAGVTVWEPLNRAGVRAGMKVGVVGLGGLGHLAVKFAHALGADVALFTRSPDKASAAKELGADCVVVSTDEDAMTQVSGQLDYILDTVAVPHDLSPYLSALRLDGTLAIVGALEEMPFDPIALFGRYLTASGSGGRPGTQRMLDFCGEHSIVADVETLPADKVDEAFARLTDGDVKYRFVLDMAALPSAT